MRKRNLKKWFSVCMASCVVASMAAVAMPEHVTAKEWEVPPLLPYQPIEVKKTGSGDVTQKMMRKEAQTASSLSEYSLVEEGYVTSVKDQNPFGTCWAFAPIASMESNILMDGGKEEDLSEYQLIYFTYKNPLRVQPGLEGDATKMVQGDFLNGGSPILGSSVLAKHTGLVEESLVPYETMSIQRRLKDEYAYQNNAYEMANADMVDLSAKKEDINTVKSCLLTRGAGCVGYYVILDNWNQVNHAIYTTAEEMQADVESEEPQGGAHIVTLVGWTIIQERTLRWAEEIQPCRKKTVPGL